MPDRSIRKKRAAVVGAALLVAGGALVVWRLAVPPDRAPPVADAPAASPTELRWIVAGGGPTPESNEISIEDDLRLAAEVFEGPGMTLYAGGPGSRAVRVEDDDLEQDPLIAELGAIFNPRPGRRSRYQAARIAADAPATPKTFLDAVHDAAGAKGKPLTVYVAGHGDRGKTAADDAIVMWANFSVTPADLADSVADARRRTRFVITTCFSGGFGELAFAGADESQGPAAGDVCGLFASTWDREAGGCDPDPDRGRHDGYGVHFLSALDGKRRDGTELKAETLDIDGDGKVSLLDAHTFARLSSKSIDVPTTTSERWLRHVVDADAQAEPIVLAHEDAVIGVLGKHLEATTEEEARRRVDALDAKLDDATKAEAEASRAETEAFWDASAAMLGRWPVLDDPWHPLWATTIAEHHDEIAAFLASAPEIVALKEAMEATDRAAGTRSQLEVERAPFDRLLRAFETKRLASALSARGGPDWDRYVALHDCENSAL